MSRKADTIYANVASHVASRLGSFTSDLSAHCSDLTHISEEAASANNTISESVQEIAHDTTLQGEETASCAGQLEIMSGNMENLSSSIKAVQLIVEEVSTIDAKTKESLGILLEDTDKANSAAKEIHTVIEKVDSAAKEISQILFTIKQIALQTKVLSLNASIEAARAGQYGKGFNVIANEVKKLSLLSEQSVTNISDLIANIQNASNDAVNRVDASIGIFNKQKGTLGESETLYNQLSGCIVSLSDEINNVNASNGAILEHKNNILGIMSELQKFAEDNAIAVQNIASSTEEQASASNAVADAAIDLNKFVVGLSELAKELTTEK